MKGKVIWIIERWINEGQTYAGPVVAYDNEEQAEEERIELVKLQGDCEYGRCDYQVRACYLY